MAKPLNEMAGKIKKKTLVGRYGDFSKKPLEV
jgi:hypothetical protein